MTHRPEHELSHEGRGFRVVEAWRSASGWGLGYALALEDGVPAEDDRMDRRFPLAPDERLDGLDAAGLREKLGEGASLTVTERRFAGGGGRPWLAQNVGPVWGEEDVAAGLTGILFTALGGPTGRVETYGGHVGELDEADLRVRLERALEDETPPVESTDGRDEEGNER